MNNDRNVSGRAEHLTSVSVALACELCAVERSFFYALVEEGVFMETFHEDELNQQDFARFCRAARLFNDLGVNPPGIALVFQLLADRA